MTRKSHSHAHGTDLGLGPSTDRPMAPRGSDIKTQQNTHKRKDTTIVKQPGPKVIKLFSCSTQLSTKFQLLIKLKYRQIKKFVASSLSDIFIMPINVKMATIFGILTFMSSRLSSAHQQKSREKVGIKFWKK